MSDPTATTSPAPDPTQPPPDYHLYPRREPFEHGLLPKLITTDTLSHLKSTLLPTSGPTRRIKPDALSHALQVSADHARLVIETLASVLPDESDDPLARATSPSEIDEAGVNVFDLLVFLYVQSYKRLLPKGHRDSAAVADVWPSTSAFDGFLSALSPLQLVRSNSRKFMPSQADEEAHQLSYLQKHLASIISLLADSTEGEGDEPLVISMDSLEHLGLLMYFGKEGSQRIPLNQIIPFFANSDPEIPAAPVPVLHVLDWLLQSIFSTLEHMADKVSSKENGPSGSPEQDVVADAKPSSRGPSFIEGISKSSYVKLAHDLKGTSVKVVNCHESAIYFLAPVKYATIYGCSDATIILGAVGKALRVEHCERVHVIVAAKRICIANCRECVFFLGVNQQPLTIGANHKLQVAPYNTFYSKLEDHMKEVGVDPNINRWDEPVTLGVVDPHDSLSHPAGVSDVQPESAARLDPNQYTNFVIPNCLEGEQAGSTKNNPFPLPDSYLTSQQKKIKSLEEVKQNLKEAQLEESRKRELSTALHACFKDWLYASGNIRQLYYVQSE